VWVGTPVVRSCVLDGNTGKILWDRGETPGLERYWGPSVNLASTTDFDGDGNADLVFTNPDYYCIASGPTGDALLGPLFPPKIFDQPSQGLYTFPVILQGKNDEPTVCLVAGHYFQAAMSLSAAPYWYKLPTAGENRCAWEGFLPLKDGQWLMGFGRQNGNFACVNVVDGRVRWELPVQASCSDVVTGDVDGDGTFEFVFGTSHGALYAVGDANGQPRVVWTVQLGGSVGSPILADINGDGASEVCVGTSTGHVFLLGETAEPSGNETVPAV
jgi:outer membrane protein assembly factor BamB